MHDEDPRARLVERPHEVAHEPVVVAPVDAHAVLHGDGLLGGVAHGGETLRDERRVEHERSPEGALLHPFARTPAVEVVFVIAEGLGRGDALSKRLGVGPAQLQRHGMLAGVETEELFLIPVQNRARRHHLGVKARTARERPVKDAAVPVRPVEHGRNRKAPVGVRHNSVCVPGKKKARAVRTVEPCAGGTRAQICSSGSSA